MTELTVPWKERQATSHHLKKAKYQDLIDEVDPEIPADDTEVSNKADEPGIVKERNHDSTILRF